MIDCDTRPELSGVADREEAVARREQATAAPSLPIQRTPPPPLSTLWQLLCSLYCQLGGACNLNNLSNFQLVGVLPSALGVQ